MLSTDFLETVNRNNQFFHGKFWDVIVSFIVFNYFHHRCPLNEILLSMSYSSFVLSFFLIHLCLHSFRHFECLVLLGNFSCFLSLSSSLCLIDETKLSALCCADHFSCSLVIVHVLAPHIIVGERQRQKGATCVVVGKIWMSIPVDFLRTRTKHSGSCAALW